MTIYRIGITGHRQIPIHIQQGIKNEIKRYLSQLVSTKGIEEIVAVSPLAAGADQLFAESALEIGLSLEVILPFQTEEYEKDFDKKELKGFRNLLKHAKGVEIVPSTENRTEAYYQTGRRVLEQCDELVAVWDFNKTNEIYAGTAHIVRCLFENFSEVKALYAIHSPRQGEITLTTNGYMDYATYQGRLIQGGKKNEV